jgi:hypothetical protein
LLVSHRDQFYLLDQNPLLEKSKDKKILTLESSNHYLHMGKDTSI